MYKLSQVCNQACILKTDEPKSSSILSKLILQLNRDTKEHFMGEMANAVT